MSRPAPDASANPETLRPDDPVGRVKGIGPKTSAALADLGIRRVMDLVLRTPREYRDRGTLVSVAEAVAGGPREVQLRGRLSVTSARYVRRRLHITSGSLHDSTGSVPVRWFNQPWMADRLGSGVEAAVAGTLRLGRAGKVELINPEVELGDSGSGEATVVPVYPRTGPLAGKRLATIVGRALDCLDAVEDPLPATVRSEFALPPLGEALRELHRPSVPERPEKRARLVASLRSAATPGHRRLAFDELLAIAAVAATARSRRQRQSAAPLRPSVDISSAAASSFPFELTVAQHRAIHEILDDLARPTPMARLLQGDVGCGKTAVATLAILAAVSGGCQAALMAPTELLAEQLFRGVAAVLEPRGHRVRLLTGACPAAEARAIREALADGGVSVVVGTHALFQETVSYDKLGLVVIDEQHRFGVAQRQQLLDKGQSPHLLVMTATPIPRSLALTVYGDLDLTVIDQLPPGRRPVRTEVREPSARPRVLEFLRAEIERGGQVYIVCPVIDPSSKLEAVSLAEHESTIRAALAGFEVGLLHGRLGRNEREAVTERFRSGELRAILATTVVEVGVDVPAASVMVVESAERFGLSQLHQLRGRVGRGDRRSWCILMTGDDPSEGARRRLRVLERTTDGFEIAEADLRHRGPGELTGLRQWGAESFRFADLLRHRDLIVQTRVLARRLADDGGLAEVRDALLRNHPVGGSLSLG